MAKTPTKTTPTTAKRDASVNQGEQRLREQEQSYEEGKAEARALFEAQDNATPTPQTGTDSAYPEPPSDPLAPIQNPNGDFYDNPENPRGIPDYLTDGAPDSQATDSQKTQNPTPQRPPLMADMDPPVSIQERVSAAQNRKPPQEVVP